MLNRRHALQLLLGANMAGWGWGWGWGAAAAAASATEQRLVVVFLRGAYDAANVLVQHGRGFYYTSRPNIVVARPGRGAEAALRLSDAWALHPALRIDAPSVASRRVGRVHLVLGVHHHRHGGVLGGMIEAGL